MTYYGCLKAGDIITLFLYHVTGGVPHFFVLIHSVNFHQFLLIFHRFLVIESTLEVSRFPRFRELMNREVDLVVYADWVDCNRQLHCQNPTLPFHCPALP